MQSADSAQLDEVAGVRDGAVPDTFTQCSHLLQTPNDIEQFVTHFPSSVHQSASASPRTWNAGNISNISSKLPHEVLIQCISHLEPGERHASLAVSQTWRSVLLAEPRLWNNISLMVVEQRELDEREATYTKMMLGRSGILPICLSVRTDSGRNRVLDDVSLAVRALAPHAHRITQVHLANVMLPLGLLQGMVNLRSVNTSAPFLSPNGMVFRQLTSIIARSLPIPFAWLEVPFPVLQSLTTTYESPIGPLMWMTFPALVDIQFTLTQLESGLSQGTPPSMLERVVFQRPGFLGILGNLHFQEDVFMNWTRQHLPRLRLALNPLPQWSMSFTDGHASFFATGTKDHTMSSSATSTSNVTVAVRIPHDEGSVELFCRELRHPDVWPQVAALSQMTFDLADLHALVRHSTGLSRDPIALWETLELHIGSRTDSLHWLQIIWASTSPVDTPSAPSWPYPLPQLKRLVVRRIWAMPEPMMVPNEAGVALQSPMEEMYRLTQFVVDSLEMVLECCFSFETLESITLVNFDKDHIREQGNLERLEQLFKQVVMIEESSVPPIIMSPRLV